MKSRKLSGHLLSDLAVLCSCILSHPLYLSYFLFFSPYLVKLLAFLSPLFITTSLLLLSLLTSFLHDSFTFSTFLENLIQLRFDRTGDGIDESNELEGFEEFEVYKIVFGEDNPVEFPLEKEEEAEEEKVLGVLISDPIEEEEKILGVLISDEGGFPAKDGEKSDNEVAGKRQDDERLDECEKLTRGVGKAGELKLTMTDKKCGEVLTVGNEKVMELTPSSINGGNQTHSIRHLEGVWNKKKHDDDDDDNYYSFSSSHSEPISPSLSNLGSMRKEKEWRRTLACKLFEERHNGENGGGSDGVEGMDLLWETYEKTEEKKGKQSSNGRKKEKEKKMDKGRVADYIQEEYGDEDDDDDEDGEVGNGQLCCLQALKFSAGKMNFGRPGFVKISKAIKGIGVGWLSHSNHRQRHQHSGGSKKGKSS